MSALASGSFSAFSHVLLCLASFRRVLVHEALGRDPARFWHLPGASLPGGRLDYDTLVAPLATPHRPPQQRVVLCES